MQSSAKATGTPSRFESGSTTGFRLISGTRLPFGRSKWARRIVFAPPLRSLSMVGRAARRRVSSLTRPPSIGTLKSTRTRARRPWSSASSRVRKVMAVVLDQLRHVDGGVAHPGREAPLVVVPGEDPAEAAVDHLGLRQGHGG